MEGPSRTSGGPLPLPPGRALLLLTGVALLVRAAFLLLEPATQPIADERTWTNWAIENLLSAKVSLSPFRTNMIFYPPLYPYFIALAYAVFGSLTAVKWVQATVSVLLVPAVGLVGCRTYGTRAGLLAAGIVVFYPELVWFSVHFWSETLFMVLIWWGMERLLAAEASRRLGVAAGAGLLWGLAILTRETVLYILPFAALWLALDRRASRAPLRGGLFLLVALLTVAPWTYRNWVRFKAFVPVSTAGGLNLFQGNTRLPRDEVYVLRDSIHGRVEQYRQLRRMGIEAILERQPLWLFEKLRDEMPKFWEADSLALIHIRRGAYGSVPPQPQPQVHPSAAIAAAIVVIVPYVLILGSFVAGVAAIRLDRRRSLLLLFLVFYNALHIVTHGFARYRLPVLPVLFVVAASAWAAWSSGRYPALTRRRKALAVALAVGFVVTLVPSFRKNLAEPAYDLSTPVAVSARSTGR
jgi:4-amino-4-deoxy-L-arabinose transferase-like glycosyltransferase